MKNLLLLPLLLCLFTITKAQNGLIYNKRFVECEDKWVAFQKNAKDTTYTFGFIYIDPSAGLTCDVGGSFKITIDGVFILTKLTTSVKARLKANRVLVALIPPAKFEELQIKPVPDWLKFYKTDTTSVAHLLRWGFLYNDYGESAKALTYLEPAWQTNPDFKGLAFELAFAYNALGNFAKALPILRAELKSDPTDCNAYQDCAYAEIHLDQIDQAAETYDAALKNCTKQSTKVEIAYNMAGHYYIKKDKFKFGYWLAEARKWITSGDRYADGLNKMEAELANPSPPPDGLQQHPKQ